MTLAVIWLAARCFALSFADKRTKLMRIAAGLLLACLVVPVQRWYVQAHPELLSLLGDKAFEEGARTDVEHR